MVIRLLSEHAMHVLVDRRDVPVTLQEAISRSMGAKVANGESSDVPPTITSLTPQATIATTGFYLDLPRVQHKHNQQEVVQSSYKSLHLSLQNLTMDLPVEEGDYLRIHHTPCRFPSVYNYSWNTASDANVDLTTSSTTTLPSVIVQEQSDFWIIDKPPLIPIHATVDNELPIRILTMLPRPNTLISTLLAYL
jgi:hypothetical protein